MNYVKGRRKTAPVPRPAGFKLGKYLLPSNIAMPALMALLFVVIVVASTFEQGLDALVLRLTGFLLFAVLAYSVRARLKAMNYYTKLIDAFAALFAAVLLWSAIDYLHLIDPVTAGVSGMVMIAVINLVVALVLIVGLLYVEKDRPATLFVQAGRLTAGLTAGIPVLIGGAVVSVVLAYLFFSAGPVDTSKLLAMAGLLAAFSVASSITCEAWFRGLFLSRLLPVAGKQAGFIIQAIVFAFFQAGIFYLFTASPVYAGAVLVISAIIGYLFAVVTVKSDSLLAAVLSGIGVNMVIALTLFAALLHV